ncbi:hypothetical protein DF107_17725 [Burkholderia stagnalis]|uniref:Uncharacterized protein n=1 Tax=Burkholderia stagnalis TaxID=1503054 RepID=A0A3P0GUB3_9BURK|nr:hypothetical protein F7R25_18605 [Burkholderia stagnalis]RQQ05245.1 hypothetical protein DF164_19845 [Burkholderia stagnalis]RQQ19648.1 hypothetical protein DF161_06655 [Burkholderia stagnalis]RQQ27494.1 hypothetical protein DF163_19445 [Burkholderia stagnalis]RQQ31536.1 hypothetical protein DF149_16050 [Burkholderia stagnalis]
MKISASDSWKLQAILRKCTLHVNKNTENSAKSDIWGNFYRFRMSFGVLRKTFIGSGSSTPVAI